MTIQVIPDPLGKRVVVILDYDAAENVASTLDAYLGEEFEYPDDPDIVQLRDDLRRATP